MSIEKYIFPAKKGTLFFPHAFWDYATHFNSNNNKKWLLRYLLSTNYGIYILILP